MAVNPYYTTEPQLLPPETEDNENYEPALLPLMEFGPGPQGPNDPHGHQQLTAHPETNTTTDLSLSHYQPMNLAIFGPGGHGQPNAPRTSNYRGDPTNMRNQSQWWLTDEQNCSFWLENLLPTVTCGMLLGSIRNIGRVYACHINNDGKHQFAAAKLTFFTAEEAQRFYRFAAIEGRLVVGGLPPRVLRHRNKVGTQYGLRDHTRVLTISGPSEIVNVPFLTAYFHGKFIYQTDEIIDHGNNGTMAVLEWRFSSWRSQARDAMLIMKSDPVFQHESFRVIYDRDPCDFQQGGVGEQ